MSLIGVHARTASHVLALTETELKRRALTVGADLIRSNVDAILAANRRDEETAKAAGKSDAMVDRLHLDESRVESIAYGILSVASLEDPVGKVIAEWPRPNGLRISRVSCPLGVIGVIYESRPNVTADAGALGLMSGNAVILRGGSDSFYSSTEIHRCLQEGLTNAGLPEGCIQLVPTTDRAVVGEMLCGLSGNVDVIVPRGGKSLVARVQSESRVPVFAHLEGICHVYVDRSADLEMARNVVLNSKMRRTGICGAVETLLIDCACIETHLLPIVAALVESGCEVRGDTTVIEFVRDKIENAKQATDEDWDTEYLDAIISVAIVDGVDGAITHIRNHSSGHTESIIAGDENAAAKFLREVDSAIVLHNASTQFADGGEFGMGAEIGIATGRMHARGPIGVEQLTTFRYVVHGHGQTRP